MVIIGEPFIQTKYKGLSDFESDMLRAYIRREQPEIRSLETRVRLGPGSTVEVPGPEALVESFRQNTQYKLDVLMETPRDWRAIEIKDRVYSNGLGQALIYFFYLMEERDFGKPLLKQVAAPEANPGFMRPARIHNVEFVPLTDEAERQMRIGLRRG